MLDFRRMSSWGLLTLAAALLGTSSHAETALPTPPTDLSSIIGQPVEHGTFDPNALLAHIRFLSDDTLRGRGTGSAEKDVAAEYIAQQFKAAGCEPAGENGTWYQDFDTYPVRQFEPRDARFLIDGQPDTLEVERDWSPMSLSAAGDFAGEVVFVGYGIRATRWNYDDYTGLDVDGKVVLMMRYEPPQGAIKGARFGEDGSTIHAGLAVKARKAARAGAIAVLLVEPPSDPRTNDELTPFPQIAMSRAGRLPFVQITQALGDRLLEVAGIDDLATLERRLIEEGQPVSTELPGVHVDVRQAIESRPVRARNVIGRLRGSGTDGETIVIGGHYDHLGTRPGQTPHNGADDNASGTAGVMELAHHFGASKSVRRDIIFMAFGAEEIGLLGSRHFVSEPTVPLEKIKAMFNFDMVGRLYGNRISVYGTETAREWRKLVRRASRKVELRPIFRKGFNTRSDHAPFIRNGIPAVFAFTGLHEDYHRPSDDWELVDVRGTAQIIELMSHVIRDTANLEEGPEFREP